MIEDIKLKQSIIALLKQYGNYLIDNGIMGFEEKTSNAWFVEKNREIVTDDFSLNGNSGIALFLIHLSEFKDFNYFIFAAEEAMTEPMEMISDTVTLDSKFSLNDLMDVVFALSYLYINSNEDDIKMAITKGLDIISNYIISNVEQSFKINLNILLTLYELFDFNRKQLIKPILAINNFLIKRFEAYDLEFLSKACDDLIIYSARAVRILNDQELNKVISNLLKIKRQRKTRPDEKYLFSRLLLKENGFADKTIDEEISDGLNNIMNSGINIKNENLSGLWNIVKRLDLIDYAKKVCTNDLISNYKDLYSKEIIYKLIFEVEQVIKYGDRNIGFKGGVTGLAYGLLRFYDPKIVTCLCLL